jgi:hypothetical protein
MLLKPGRLDIDADEGGVRHPDSFPRRRVQDSDGSILREGNDYHRPIKFRSMKRTLHSITVELCPLTLLFRVEVNLLKCIEFLYHDD